MNENISENNVFFYKGLIVFYDISYNRYTRKIKSFEGILLKK